ncbi:Protein MAIN-LIKE 2 [Linum perenne]
MGLEQIRAVLRLTPDQELIIVLIERWRLETNTFHLYHGEATITLEDIHFITGLSVDGLPVTSDNLIPTRNDELVAYVGSLLGKTPATSDLNSGRIKMTGFRSNFPYKGGTIRDDDTSILSGVHRGLLRQLCLRRSIRAVCSPLLSPFARGP